MASYGTGVGGGKGDRGVVRGPPGGSLTPYNEYESSSSSVSLNIFQKIKYSSIVSTLGKNK